MLHTILLTHRPDVVVRLIGADGAATIPEHEGTLGRLPEQAGLREPAHRAGRRHRKRAPTDHPAVHNPILLLPPKGARQMVLDLLHRHRPSDGRDTPRSRQVLEEVEAPGEVEHQGGPGEGQERVYSRLGGVVAGQDGGEPGDEEGREEER